MGQGKKESKKVMNGKQSKDFRQFWINVDNFYVNLLSDIKDRQNGHFLLV